MPNKNLTPESRILILEEKDLRRDAHYKNLNLKIDELTASQKQMIDLLAGTNLNGNKGLVRLLETVEEKVNLNKDQVKDMQKDIDNVKFWGRGAAGLLFMTILAVINYVKDKI